MSGATQARQRDRTRLAGVWAAQGILVMLRARAHGHALFFIRHNQIRGGMLFLTQADQQLKKGAIKDGIGLMSKMLFNEDYPLLVCKLIGIQLFGAEKYIFCTASSVCKR